MTIRAVGFDLDYTLAVPTRDRATILQDAATAAGAPPLSREAYLDAHQRNLTRETRTPIFEDLLDARDSDADAAAVATAYREHIADALVPLAGAETFLSDLRERYRVGLLTNGPRVAQRDKLDTLGWQHVFDVALVTGELPAGKPDAAAFEALLDGLGTDAGETAYVGDDVDADIGGAANAGLVPIQVVFDGGPDPDPRAAEHVERDDLFSRLPEVLDDL
ncbi:HAD family hydrolase [Halogeometricum limi]|uniref:Putative hydrolase of the HAD superfamily n=1 Tax=Halogeometricum limi TaxID=555875 RepID=A0A1I6HEJ1_9EURY|nr:HAD family hydrolase [Halogeometricum limi]SFR52916.1 putative hydrolase of the HAD superfamily [Halogeometricum limi]